MFGIIDRWIATEIDWETAPQFSVLGVDEIAIKKGQRDDRVIATACCTKGELHLLALLHDCTKEPLGSFLQSIPTALRHTLRTVCTDMWVGYGAAIQEALPRVALVLDRFPVAGHYHDCADTLRKREFKRLRTELLKDTPGNANARSSRFENALPISKTMRRSG